MGGVRRVYVIAVVPAYFYGAVCLLTIRLHHNHMDLLFFSGLIVSSASLPHSVVVVVDIVVGALVGYV